MYNIPNSIVKCTHLRLMDNFKDIRNIALKTCDYHYQGKREGGLVDVLHFGTDEEVEDRGIYESGVLVVPDFGGITILQDYGDNETSEPDGFMAIPRELVFGYDSEISIGLYNDRCCVIFPHGSQLIVNMLDGEFIKEINWDRIRHKRPFSTIMVIPKEFDMESDVSFMVDIRMEGLEKRYFTFTLPFKYKDIFNPDKIFDFMNECVESNLSDGLELMPYQGLTCFDKKTRKFFITSDYLIYKEFLLRRNADDGCLEWYNGDVVIKSPSTNYYAVYTGDMTVDDYGEGWKYIWYTEDVDKLLGE